MKNLGYKIPEDVVIEILSRLPVKTLLRFKCACTTWFSIIGSHCFIQKHLNMALEDSNKARLFIVHRSNKYEKFFTSFVNDDELTLQTNLSFDTKRLGRISCVMGPCHGLFCIYYERHNKLLLWNPATRETKDIPKSSIPLPSNENTAQYVGFGFDSNTRDYKVVKILIQFHRDRYSDYHVEVYTLSTNSWRKIEATISNFDLCSYMFPTYWNGTYYWWGQTEEDYEDIIVCFDMCIEQFYKILLPTEVLPVVHGRKIYANHCFTEYNGSLGVIFCFMGVTTSLCELWTMNGHGAKVSWTKQYYIGLFETRTMRPLMILKSKIILLTNENHDIIPYDHVTQTMRAPLPDDAIIKIKSYEWIENLWITSGGSYTESLVRIGDGK
ncbi:F-box protein CPR30 [Forsythia ovata]|uniref:F-box protein CPR30 n=1 Tax=Forsythia ovata TaxID=205694 RepID=A0ABD1R1V1_9LAMI